MINRDSALALLHDYTQTDSLRRHAYAVAASMEAYAKKYGEDVDKWYITGLLHDFDYEKYPTEQEHTVVSARILGELGYPEDVIYAIRAHANYNHLERVTLLSKCLFACDELSGFVMAVAMVRPSKRVADVEVASVKKKLKDKAFAKGVNRQDVYDGAQEMALDLDKHIAFVITALTEKASILGLEGTTSA